MVDADVLGMTGLVARWQDTLALVGEEESSVAEESPLVNVTPAPHGGWRVALVPCQILIDWYGDCMNPFGGPRPWNAPEGGPPCQGKEHTR